MIPCFFFNFLTEPKFHQFTVKVILKGKILHDKVADKIKKLANTLLAKIS